MEATAEIMRTEGYAAVTTRRVAAEVGVRSALLYYYFPTMEDLLVAVMRNGAELSLARMRQAITDDDPLRALWLINTDTRYTALNTEFMALANHRKMIADELKSYAERVRDIETTAVTLVMRAHGLDLQRFPPVVMSILLTGAARIICNEGAVGMRQGHEELRAFMEGMIARFRLSPPLTEPSDEPAV
ncbi:helix-turn-helix domain-containing protein [Nocardia sp. NPDC005366]|uniref:TetR/AcrR family transcriptional regulator n=1 Tax=Nocardia sp. NPDC005366 TaxID=3156878 RepID=UPI0033A89B28